MRTFLTLAIVVLASLAPAPVGASTFTLFEQSVFLHIGTGGGSASPLVLDPTAPGYTDALDVDGYGSYGWMVVNETVDVWEDVTLIYFLDGEWDYLDNGYSNEYGEFLGLGLPDGAPAGSLAPNGWEIDEPGYVSGDIYFNALSLGALDNTNAVPAGAVDDVSLAFAWTLSSLAPGDRIWLTLLHQSAGLSGIAHSDPDSGATMVVNGHVVLERAPVDPPDPDPDPDPPVPVPEPGVLVLLGAALIATGRTWRRAGRGSRTEVRS